MKRSPMLLLPTALLAFSTMHVSQAREVDMDVPVAHQADNPCTDHSIRILGDIGVAGAFQSVEEGYRFMGEVDFSALEAVSEASQKRYQARPVGDDQIAKTVDFPVDTTLSQDVEFEGPDQDLIGDMTARINVGFFNRDVSIESVELMCRNGPLSSSSVDDET